MEDKSKVFFSAGDLVTLKQEVPNKPIMIVKTVDKIKSQDDRVQLLGVTCIWFSTKQELQTERFSTKDLIHYEWG